MARKKMLRWSLLALRGISIGPHAPYDAMNCERKALLLSVGYGRGHHAAAQALAEELTNRGWTAVRTDICAETHPRLFRLTQRFYHLCVRRMPWVWGALYKQLDTADWTRLIRLPGLAGCVRRLHRLIEAEKPDLIVCTYPLFAYMLDALASRGLLRAPYAVVVTDALAISRAWVQMQAPLICLPDELSLTAVQERFALPDARVAATGFPVRSAFAAPSAERPLPGPEGEQLHIVYGPYAPAARVAEDVEALLKRWPRMHISLPSEESSAALRRLEAEHPEHVRIYEAERAQDMASLLSSAHFYIGKAGAATLFEAYTAETPVLVNYALPGQEEGNLQLLLHDGAGCYAGSTEELLEQLSRLLAHAAAGWQSMRRSMRAARRAGGAARTVDALERRFFP